MALYENRSTDELLCVTDVGLILVASDTPIGRLYRSITKQDYDSVGYYYVSGVSGCQKFYYTMLDQYSLCQRVWDSEDNTLENLAQNPMISKLDLRPLAPNVCAEELSVLKNKFRREFTKIFSEVKEKSLEEVLYQLFGHRVISPSCGMTALEMVNTVIERVGVAHLVPQSDTVLPQSHPGYIKSDAEGLAQFFQLVGLPFKTQVVDNPNAANKLLASYVDPNCLFGNKIFRVTLPCRKETDLKQSYIIERHRSSEYLSKLMKTFVTLIVKDAEFFGTVVSGLNDQRKCQLVRDIFFSDTVEKLAAYTRQLVLQTQVTCETQAAANDTIAMINGEYGVLSDMLGGCVPQIPTYDTCVEPCVTLNRVETRVEVPVEITAEKAVEAPVEVPVEAPAPVEVPVEIPEVRAEPPKGMVRVNVAQLTDEFLIDMYKKINSGMLNTKEFETIKIEVQSEMTRRGISL